MRPSQAQAEGLTLLKSDNKAGYFGVNLANPGYPKPYEARVTRGGKRVSLGCFPTAEEAALCFARSPEGQEAAKRPAAVPPLTDEEAQQQAEAEGLTLLKANTKTGYFCVYLTSPGYPKPYTAKVWRGSKAVCLGTFATAEEAALCVARSPEGQAATVERAAAVPPLTSAEAQQQAQAEGLTLLKADNATGYFGVQHQPGRSKPYLTRVSRDGKLVYLGSFATTEEAALCIARSPEGQAAAKKPAAAPPLTSDEAQRQARAQGLMLLKADNTAGYYGVHHKPGRSKPYLAEVWRGGKLVYLGCFVTAEEAALCIARTPEGRAAAAARAAPMPQLRRSEEERQGKAPARRSRAVLKQEGDVPPMPSGAFVKEEGIVPPMPPGAFVKEEVVVKREHEVVVDYGGPSEGRRKRRKDA